MVHGEQFVMMDGALKMPMLSAGNSGLEELFLPCVSYTNSI